MKPPDCGVGRRPRRPSRDDQPAAAGLRPHGRGRAAEDCGQPPHRRPGPDDGQRALRTHRRRQDTERAAVGPAWDDTGYVFTTSDGQPLHPDYLTRRFRFLVEQSGLPPVRLHDLRHGAASLAHSAGADLKIMQEQLGHASIRRGPERVPQTSDFADVRSMRCWTEFRRRPSQGETTRTHRVDEPSPAPAYPSRCLGRGFCTFSLVGSCRRMAVTARRACPAGSPSPGCSSVRPVGSPSRPGQAPTGRYSTTGRTTGRECAPRACGMARRAGSRGEGRGKVGGRRRS